MESHSLGSINWVSRASLAIFIIVTYDSDISGRWLKCYFRDMVDRPAHHL